MNIYGYTLEWKYNSKKGWETKWENHWNHKLYDSIESAEME